MEKPIARRPVLKSAGVALAFGLPAMMSGCVAPRISPKAMDKGNGKPWRCGYCGHLTRSQNDLSTERCPRCRRKELRPVGESEFAEYLKQ